MGQDLTVRAVVEAILQGEGFEQAKAKLQEVAKQAQSSGAEGARGVGQLNDALNQVGLNLGKIASIGFLAGLIKSSVVEWAGLERQLNAVNVQLVALGEGAAMESVRSFIDGMTAIGRTAETTAQAINRFVGITRDANAAMAAAKLASDLAAGGLGSFEGNVEAISALFKGRFQGALAMLGASLDEHGRKITNAADAYEALQRKAEILAGRQRDLKSEMASASGQWELMKEKIGSGFAQLYSLLWPVIDKLLKVPAFIGEGWGQTFNLIINGAKAVGIALGAAFNLKELFASPKAYLHSVEGAINNAYALIKDTIADAARGMIDVWKDQPEAAAKATQAGKDKILALLKGMAGDAKETSEKVVAVHDETVEKWLAAQQQAREADLQARRAALQSELELAAKGSAQRAILERQLLDIEQAEAIAKFKGTEGGKLAIAAEFTAKRIALANREAEERQKKALDDLKRLYDDQIAGEQAAMDTEREVVDDALADFQSRGVAYLAENLDAYKQYLDRKLALLLAELDQEEEAEKSKVKDPDAQQKIHEKYNEKRRKASKQTATEEIKNEKAVAQSKRDAVHDGLSALAQAFPQFKAFAIANALISTYEGVDKALSAYPPPWSFIAAAGQLAFGLAQVRQIQSQNVAMATGGVVTGPTNALVGEAGTEAVIPLESSSAMSVLSRAVRESAPQPAGAAVGNVDAGVHVHFHGPTTMVGGSAGVRELTRLINKEQTRNAARYVR